MTERCDDLHGYVDGELGEDEAAAFEAHLVTCQTCQAELPRLLTLLAALDDAAKVATSAPPRVPHLVLVGDGPAERAAERVAEREAEREPARDARRDARPGRPPSSRRWQIAGVAVAAGLVFALWPRPDAAPQLALLEGRLGSSRPIEARLSYPGADGYRPLDVARGAAPTKATESLLALERQYEQGASWHGAAVLAILAGDREHAAHAFDHAQATPDVESDRAALELQDGSPAALERALEHVDRALAASPGLPAAQWNRALILAAMGLPLAAARELDAVRARNEPGWADEAATRAAALRAQVTRRRTHWREAHDVGQRMVEDGTPASDDLADVVGVMTIDLYDAVRAAPSRERVLALLPLAHKLDAAYRNTRLVAYVERVAAADVRIRQPLADRYRALATGHAAPGTSDALLRDLAKAGPAVSDIRLGALVFTGRVAAELDEYRKLAAVTDDPWFALIAEREAAMAAAARGDTAAAERRLRDAIALARRERMAYRAIRLESDLVQLYKNALDISQAAAAAQVAYREAIAAGEWVLEMSALGDLSSIQQNRYAFSLARAYLTELAERAEDGLASGDKQYASVDCLRRLYAYGGLAHISLLVPEPDPSRARAELARAPSCPTQGPISDTLAAMILRAALVRAELYRLGHRTEDAQLARDGLAALRDVPDAPGSAVRGKDAFISYVEGDLTIGDDPAGGRRALRQAIAQAGRDPGELSVKARAYSFSLLALEDGRAGAYDQVIAGTAEALNVQAPARCALAVAADGGRHVVAFTDAQGAAGGQYVARAPGALDVASLVPGSVVDRLGGCARVAVLARAPVLGAGRLLPPSVAWSYVVADPAPAAAPAGAAQRLVVANPEAPPELGLPPLGPYPAEPAAGVTVLRGADATPSRVLVAMQAAQVIEFHTHGLIADDLFEASHLVLSPEVDRRHALTAADVAHIRLAARPLVILGSCRAAASSHVLEGGMGLAEGFLRAGARAVIASPDAVQDLGAQAFFAAVRDRVVQGADPATALRDERVRHLATAPDEPWVSGVVVFQ